MGLDPQTLELLVRHLAGQQGMRPAPSQGHAAPGQSLVQPDPYNPYNGAPGGGAGGIQIDPRYVAQLAQHVSAAMGGGEMPNQGMPGFAPMVGEQAAQPHPALRALAQALAGAAQMYNSSGARQNTGLAAGLNFASGLGSGFARQGERVDQQNATNRQAAMNANQLNWLASQEAEKEKRAQAGRIELKQTPSEHNPSTLLPVTEDMLRVSGVTGYTAGQMVGKDVWEAIQSEAKRRMPPARGSGMGNGAFGADFDPHTIAQGIHDRTIAPDPAGFSRGQWGMIATAYLNDFHGDSLATRTGEWKRFTKNIATMEGSKFTQMGVNLGATDSAIALARQYSDELSRVAPRYAATPINRLAQLVQQNYNFGSPQVSAAVSRFVAQAEATRLQLASVYMNGGSPTDQSMKHASEIIDYRKPPAAFAAQLDVAQADVQLRRNEYDRAHEMRQNVYANPGGGRVRMKAPGAKGKVYEFDAAHAEDAKAHGYVEVP